VSEQAKETVTFYCVKCRAKSTVPAFSVKRESKPKGPDILHAHCRTCMTKMAKFVKRQAP